MTSDDQFAPGGSTLGELRDENERPRQLVGYDKQLYLDLKKEADRGCAIGFRARRTIEYIIPTPKKLPEPAGMSDLSLEKIWQRNQAG